jgi:hypothetical protein
MTTDDMALVRQYAVEQSESAFATGSIGLRVYGDPVKPCAGTFSNLTIVNAG